VDYSILTCVIATFVNQKRFGKTRFLNGLVDRFRVPDANEKTAIAGLLNAVRIVHPEMWNRLLRLALEAADSLDGQRSPHVVLPALVFAIQCFTETPPTPANTQDVPLYFRYVLPLLGALHFRSLQTQIAAIVELFVKNLPLVTNATIRALLQRFQVTRSSKAIEFL
jgi:hypothetical protein